MWAMPGTARLDTPGLLARVLRDHDQMNRAR